MPAVSVVVPARDAAGTVGALLDALAAQRLEDGFEVIVVDNGSRDDTAVRAESHPLAPRVLRRPRGEGPGAARNEGVTAARAAAIAFTDADCEPAPTWLAAGLRALADADLVQGRVEPPPGVRVGPFDRTLWVGSEYGLYETANIFVRRAWFDRVGGFEDWADEAGRPFGEDAWFGWRVRRAGGRTAFGAEALVHHAVFPGTAREFVLEAARLAHFAGLAARIPELRETFFYRRWFLARRSAAFDLALLGGFAGLLARSRVPLLAAAPYAVELRREAARRSAGRSAAVVAAVVARDAVGFAALVRGSVRARSVVL